MTDWKLSRRDLMHRDIEEYGFGTEDEDDEE